MFVCFFVCLLDYLLVLGRNQPMLDVMTAFIKTEIAPAGVLHTLVINDSVIRLLEYSIVKWMKAMGNKEAETAVSDHNQINI